MQSCESNGREEKLLKLEKGELDHVCDFFPSYQYDSVMECSDSLLHVAYKCGACDKDFSTICALHNHLQDHVAGGSYHYDHVCRTATPKFDTCCAYTQTELITDESRNILEFSVQDFQANGYETATAVSKGNKKARGRPKGSKNMFSKKRKLLNGSPVRQNEEEESDKVQKFVTQDIKIEMDACNEYNDDTDVESDISELRKENDKGSVESKLGNNSDIRLKAVEISGSHDASFEERNTQLNDEGKLEAEADNAANGEKPISTEIKPVHGKSDDTVDHSAVETKMPKNKRKMIQPRKVLKQDGKNKFKNKTVFRNHVKPKKKHTRPVTRVQIKQGFSLVVEETDKSDDGLHDNEMDHADKNERKQVKSKLFKCGLCSLTMSKYKMMRHNCEKENQEKEKEDKSERKPPKRMKCPICGVSFIRSEYSAHVRTHTGERPFICEKCGKDFARIKYLKKHLITHEEIKPFTCNICGAGFCQNKEYKQHMCSHTGEREHICNVCDATFICKASLLTHVQNIHLGETRFECDVCMRRFFKKSSLNLHRATHFEAALSCQYCSKKFKDTTGLKRHEKIHTGVKNFKCHLCDHAFVQSTPFWSHMEKRHALSKEEAKKVHKENIAKAKIIKHTLKNQKLDENEELKSEPAVKSSPILQQPLSYNTAIVGANETDEFEVNNKGYSTVNLNPGKAVEYTHHILTNVNPHASVTNVNGNDVDSVNYSQTLDLSKYTIVPRAVSYDTACIKTDFGDYTNIDDDSASDTMHKTVEVDTLPTSSQFENPEQKYDVEMFEKVQSDLRDYSRYQYDALKRDEQYADLYDPINYEKVHDLSNPEQKAAKVGASRYEESTGKERNSPQEPYSGFVKVPDPSLYSWNKRTGQYEKLTETTEAHTIGVSDQFRLVDKSAEIHGLKMSDLLPSDKPQDLSFLGIAAYQNYLNSAQGQGYFDRLLIQSHYEKSTTEFDKELDHSPYSSEVVTRVAQELDQNQVLSRVQSPYESVQDQSNISM